MNTPDTTPSISPTVPTPTGLQSFFAEEAKNAFEKKITPKPIQKADELFLFRCPGCGGVHMRHAGHVSIMLPYVKGNREKNIANDEMRVQICVKCKKSYVWYDHQMYDISELIDVQAWEKAEEELHAATGPGGNC